jgi:Cu2+-exporting ATPase
VRARARGAIERLALLRARGALVRRADGTVATMPADRVCIDDIVLVRPGERVAADGVVLSGHSSLDVSLITGESTPVPVGPGTAVLAGTLNGGGALEIRVRAVAEDSHLADIVRLVEHAECRRGRHVMLADRVVRWWTPCIHALAAATFALWLLTGHDGFTALVVAVSVLIIACPCAIGLAVPAVQVVATTALMRAGVLVRAGDALERLAAVDTVVFDKTGTLTCGRELTTWPDDARACALAAGLAALSTHPAARAIRAGWRGGPTADVHAIVESPGLGLTGQCDEGVVRLGGRAFCGLTGVDAQPGMVWLTRPGAPAVAFPFHERLRDDARSTSAALRAAGLEMHLLSGDHPDSAAAVGAQLGVPLAAGGADPAAKVAVLASMARRGARVLMVGDGLNDAPALAAAHVSASFTHGAAASQAAADLILPGERLGALVPALRLARRALTIVRQNLIFALVYNVALIPLAMAGRVTPLIASVAMSLSSLTVTLNALRAGRA